MTVKSCDILLIRHGETDWNSSGRLQGHTDIPLNSLGRQQAAELNSTLMAHTFSAAFTSDLVRAKQTAEIALGEKQLSLISSDQLRERSFGSWEGKMVADLKKWLETNGHAMQHFSYDKYLTYKWQSDVESYEDVYNRVVSYLQQQLSSHLGSTILLSTHGGVLRAFLYKLCFKEKYKWEVPNCATLKIRLNEKGDVQILEHSGISLLPGMTVFF